MFHNGMFGGGMLFGWIFWIALIGVAIYFSLKHFRTNSESIENDGINAIDLLKKRYANGDIDRDEYFKIRNDLSHGR